MKKLFTMFLALMAITMVSCEYDDSGILSEIESLKNRVQALEQLCAQSNTNIASLQALVEALQQRDYVKSVAPITEGDKVIGYTITFAMGDPITIYHGKDGQDGNTPVIGVAKDEDGIYYWTLDGEWLTDDEGNNIQAIGNAPELKIKNDYWYVSYDGGDNWIKLGKATGADGATGATGAKGDSFFKNVKIYDDYIEFILSNGSSIILPRDTAFEAELEFMLAVANGGTIKLTQDVTLSKTAVIAAGESVVLDLNGHDLTSTGSVIENNGTLIIKGYGKVASSVLRSTIVAPIVNKGTLILEGGAYNFEPASGTIATGYQAYKSGGYWNVIPADAVVIEAVVGDYGKSFRDAVIAATEGSTLYIGANAEFNLKHTSNYNIVDKSLTLIGLEGAVIGGDKAGLRPDSQTKDACVVNVKNLTIKNGNGWAPVYAKNWATVNLYDVVCETTSGIAILLDSSNGVMVNGVSTHVEGVTTTINAYNVTTGDGTVEFMATPCSAYSAVTAITKTVFTYEGGDITAAKCKPQDGAKSTGSNMYVNGKPLPAANNN